MLRPRPALIRLIAPLVRQLDAFDFVRDRRFHSRPFHSLPFHNLPSAPTIDQPPMTITAPFTPSTAPRHTVSHIGRSHARR